MGFTESKKNMIKIRKATLEDAERIGEINFISVTNYYRWIINDEYLNSLKLNNVISLRQQYLIEEEDNPETFTLVYEENWVVLWFIKWWVITKSMWTIQELNKYKNELYSFYLDLDSRWRWIWAQLMEAYKQYLKQIWINKFCVWCLKENISSKEFYELAWGILCWERKIKFGDFYNDEVLYRYEI